MQFLSAKSKFHFLEGLALRNSLYEIGEFVLNQAVSLSEASSGIFLYSAPGSHFFEKVSAIGLSKKEEETWSHLERISDHPPKNPLLDALQTQKWIETKSKELTIRLSFPLLDAGIASAGFSIEFATPKNVSKEMREFLLWMSEQAELALFRPEGEGV